MTQIVPVEPGFSEVVASGPQYGVKYVLTGMQGDGVRVVFNDPTDADYVGMLSNISGLDSPDVREAADDLIGDDGGVHGNFYHGRRPIVLEGTIDNRPNPGIHYEIVNVPGTRDWTPADLTGLALWLDASQLGLNDSDAVSTWTDLSTNGRNATASGTNRPLFKVNQLNGLPSVQFDGGDDKMDITIPADASQTIFVVARATSQSAGKYLLSRGGTANGAIRIRATNGWEYFQNQAATAVTIDSTTAATTAALITLKGTSNASVDAYYNGGTAVNFDPNDVWGTNANMTIGADPSVPTNFFPGHVHEVIVYDGTLSDADRANVAGYLAAKWGLGFGTVPAQVATSVPTQVTYEANRVRNIRMTALQRVTNAMRKDMQMRWTPEGGVEQMIYLRRQQPLRISGGFNKTFQAALVSADPRIYGSAIKEARMNVGVQTTVRNQGSIRTQPVATIYGPSTGTMTGIEVHNHTTGEYMVLAPAYALGVGQSIVIDFANKTIQRETGTNIYDQIVFASSTWWQVEPGDNLIELHGSGTTTNANMVLRWQDAWV